MNRQSAHPMLQEAIRLLEKADILFSVDNEVTTCDELKIVMDLIQDAMNELKTVDCNYSITSGE